MAHNEIHVDASPETVFGVLADPRSFARWVVGSRKIRRADPDWPAPGTAFDHAVGFGPFVLEDHSCVEECERPRLLRLLVKLRPISRAHVTLQMTPEGRGAHVAMDEHAADARSRLLFNRFTDRSCACATPSRCGASRRSPRGPSRCRRVRCRRAARRPRAA